MIWKSYYSEQLSFEQLRTSALVSQPLMHCSHSQQSIRNYQDHFLRHFVFFSFYVNETLRFHQIAAFWFTTFQKCPTFMVYYSSSFFSFIVLFCLLDITCKTLSESVLCLHYSSSSQFCDGQIVDIFFVQTPVVEGYDLFYPYRNLTLPVPHYCDVSLPPIEVISVCVADRDMDKHWLHCWKCHF